MKILILKPSSLGDVIQALPVLRLLKLHWPDAEIFWWIDSALAPLLEGDPDLSGVLRFERKRWRSPLHWPEMLGRVLQMRRMQFDLVIDLQCLARSGAFAWLARGEFLIGLDTPREGARGFYDLAVRRQSFYTHAVDWYLSVLPALDVPVHKNFTWLPPRPETAAAVDRRWPSSILHSKAKSQKTRWIALQPGARWANKRWPVEHFTELVRQLPKEFPQARFAILGGKEDHLLGEIISQGAPGPCLNLCGQTSLLEMVEWLRRCELLVTNDTGPMHAAAALGTPLVALFGPTEPRRTGPYGQLQNVLNLELSCSPCLRSRCHFELPEECLRALAPARVLGHIRKVLGQVPR